MELWCYGWVFAASRKCETSLSLSAAYIRPVPVIYSISSLGDQSIGLIQDQAHGVYRLSGRLAHPHWVSSRTPAYAYGALVPGPPNLGGSRRGRSDADHRIWGRQVWYQITEKWLMSCACGCLTPDLESGRTRNGKSC